MSILPAEQYSYSNEESLELLIHSVKGNRLCNNERKAFNVCRATVLGKLVEPEFCKDRAITFINCFHKARRDESAACKSSYTNVFECALRNSNRFFDFGSPCQGDLDKYLDCQ